MLRPDWFASNKETVHSFSGIVPGSEILNRALLGSLKKVDTWDYQVNAVAASLLQYTVHPSIALINNVGFGQDATHTIGRLSPNYFFEGADLTREEWILSAREFLKASNSLPPFIREVSDLAYIKPNPFKRLIFFYRKILKRLSKTLLPS